MKVIYLILICIFNLILLISAKKKITSCQYRIREKSNVLVSVEKSSKCYYDKYLKITDKEISQIAPNAFKNITIQELILDLTDDKLILDTESFNGLPLIKNLEFRSKLNHSDINIFQGINYLRSLKLIIDAPDKTLVESIPYGFKNLTTLSLQKSVIKTIGNDENCDYCGTLLILGIYKSEIGSLGQKAFELFKNLNNLKLIGDNLTELQPEIFYGLNKLKYLSLSGNRLTELKKNIFNKLDKLKSLDLSNNLINNIEVDTFIGNNLTYLSLSKNNIAVISTDVFRGLVIRDLYFTDNKIIKIEDDAFKNTTIKKLGLINVQINVEKEAWGLKKTTIVQTKRSRSKTKSICKNYKKKSYKKKSYKKKSYKKKSLKKK